MEAGLRAGGDETIEISIERLNYGKLAIGDDLRIPSSEGYGVTRRSRGLERSRDRALLPPRLMDVRRFERDHVDERLQDKGCLLVRVAPVWPCGETPPVTLLRARFRPEDGESGHGRLYQQSAIWVIDAKAWRRHPAALLDLAEGELAARPDLLRECETARFCGEPLRRRVADYSRGPRHCFAPSSGAASMLEMLACGAGHGEDRVLTFGEGDEFGSESGFLAAAGAALQSLPENFPRWRDISILSGLRNALPGLCIRFLPSHRAAQTRAAA